VDFSEVIRRRRMVRDFDDRPVDAALLDRLLDAARRAPSAGNTQGWHFVVLEGSAQTKPFWDAALPPGDRRERFRWQGLLRAPVVVIPLADRRAYLDRYAEPDKAATGLSEEDRWPVPYWQLDTAFATMLLLLAATDAGLGALFFGIFHGEAAVLAALGVPDGLTPIGAVAVGHPRPDRPDAPGRSASRPRRSVGAVVHRGRW
jgi:nitroreductase